MASNLSIIERAIPVVPRKYTWSFPGSPIKIELHLSVVERLQQLGKAAGGFAEKHGLLLGRPSGRTTEISACRPAAGAGAAAVESIAGAAGASLAGYFRIQAEGALRLNAQDLELAEKVFHDPHQVILLIQPAESGPASATFFFWDEGRMCGDFAFLEFPFDASLLEALEKQKQQRETPRLEAVPAPAAAPPPRRRKAWKAATGVAIAMLAAGGAGAGFMAGKLFPERTAAPAAAAALPPAPAPKPAIGLQAERQNGNLKLSWNRASEAVAGATSGTLTIIEGDTRQEIALDAQQLQGGSIFYLPVTGQVQVQLSITGPQGTASESALVLFPKVDDATAPPPSATLLPAAPAPEGKPRPVWTRPFVTPAAQHTARPASASVADPPLVSNLRPEAIPSLQVPPVHNPLPELARPAAPQPARPAGPAPVVAALEPAVILEQVAPAFPPSLKSLVTKPKTVEVRVSIDETGKVRKAEAVPSGEWVPQLMVSAARDAARLWKFRPALKGAQPVASEMVLQFAFRPPQ